MDIVNLNDRNKRMLYVKTKCNFSIPFCFKNQSSNQPTKLQSKLIEVSYITHLYSFYSFFSFVKSKQLFTKHQVGLNAFLIYTGILLSKKIYAGLFHSNSK